VTQSSIEGWVTACLFSVGDAVPVRCFAGQRGGNIALTSGEGSGETVTNQDLIKASKSALICSAWVVGIPCGNPGYDLSVPCFRSFTDFAPVVGNGQI